MCVYIYIYTYIHTCMYVYIHIYHEYLRVLRTGFGSVGPLLEQRRLFEEKLIIYQIFSTISCSFNYVFIYVFIYSLFTYVSKHNTIAYSS